ncbi:S41 family peptidase [Carboxylicivirga sp. N1Y90]|uniref:S41 family peptidase n=1 Tax=Carboxylicivirga fragile TaxID=3417571 RepID=UPI003D32DC51|nr:PD40 domain-containing protein [Marinilabiliaceae bacterium N1Y90]
MHKLITTLALLSLWAYGSAQIDARMFRYPDVSNKQITFTYAGDIWIVSKDGGTATKLSSPQGEESYPKFSPDGNTIAFSGNYSGNTDVYTIPVNGGIPTRHTWHGYNDRVVDWHPNGKQVLFASSRKSGKARWNQFYLTQTENGLPQKLPLEHAEFGSISEDGNTIAFTDKSRLTRTWKRYRGGTAPDIWLMDMNTKNAEKIAQNTANNELPMIKGNEVYFLSDRGEAKRYNLWKYDITTKEVKQLTSFTDYDVHYPSMGPADIVFEAAGKLHTYALATGALNEVKVNVITDQQSLLSREVNLKGQFSNAFLSHDAKRVVLESRGEVFTIPEEHGYTINLTQTSGAAERSPAWSPNGKYIAYWSDQSGEYQLVLRDMEDGSTKSLTSFTDGFRYHLHWSPDSKKLVFIEQNMEVKLLFVDTKEVITIDKQLYYFHGGLDNFKVSWDCNSQWVAYAKDTEKRTSAIALFDVNNRKAHQVTSAYYADSEPVFDVEGKCLYFTTMRHFSPQYSDFDNSFIYPKSTMIAAVPLTKDGDSPLAFRNDGVEVVKEEDKAEEGKDEKKKKDKKGDKEDDEEEKVTQIDIDGFESRLVLLPIKNGDYRSLTSAEGKILYMSQGAKAWDLKYYDLKEREEKSIVAGIDDYQLAANGEKILVRKKNSLNIISATADQKLDKPLNTKGMMAKIDPKQEWLQIYRDAWRLERDYFYDKNMHGVDWDAVYQQYLPLLEECVTRWDVNFVLGEMIGELNASHSYKGGGDTEKSKTLAVAYLGADFAVKDNNYIIKHIVKGGIWDAEAVSPLATLGVSVKEGDYLFAVNGTPFDIKKSPYAALQGYAGKTVELTIGSSPDINQAKKVVLKTMKDEYRLRHLEWIENKRARVAEASNNQVGYIYVPSTGVDGQNELIRQFMGQWTKAALIIDERFNNGGQIPDRFIELLNRKPLAFWAVRDGKDWQWPPVAHFGPKAMLINGWSGSGGDAFPDYFRKAELGKLVGTRTWGGLIGVSGVPALIDGGVVTAPTFRMYDPYTGDWFKEGHGVDPDVEVDEDAGQLAKGIDPQLEKAIEVILESLKTDKFTEPDHQKFEVR